MAVALVQRERWRAQPTYRCDVDWRHPLLTGVEIIFVPFWQGAELARGMTLTDTNFTTAKTGYPSGIGQKCGSTEYRSYTTPLTSSSPWTIASVLAPFNVAVSTDAQCIGTAEAPGSGTFDRQIAIKTSQWNGYLYDGASKFASSGLTAVLGRQDTVIATTNGSTLVGRANGSEGSTSVSNAGYTGYSSPEFLIGNCSGVSLTSRQFDTLLVLKINAYWDLGARQAFVENPWQVFAPSPRRVYGFVSVGAPASRLSRLSLMGVG